MAGPVTLVRRRTSTRERDRGDVVVGWLVRVVASVAVVGVLLFDVVSVGAAKMSVIDQAGTAARAASDDWLTHHNQQAAFDAAWTSAIESNATNSVDTKSFRVDQTGTVRLDVHRTAPTLLLHLVPPLRHWADVTGSGVGRPAT